MKDKKIFCIKFTPYGGKEELCSFYSSKELADRDVCIFEACGHSNIKREEVWLSWLASTIKVDCGYGVKTVGYFSRKGKWTIGRTSK